MRLEPPLTLPVHVVVAPDKFKGSLTAQEVARCIADGLRAGFTAARGGGPGDLVTTLVPLADGGEGTVDAAVAAGWRRLAVRVAGPTGEPVDAVLARDGAVALVEMAQASGLDRLPGGVRAPLTASTRGTGELVRAALDDGAREVVLAVGGSASTDGGAGLLAALGARLLDADGAELPDGGAALADLDRLDLTGLDPRLAATRWVLAADVDNPLLGPRGAAAVFGPQKGAGPGEVPRLDAALARFADALAQAGGRDAREAPGAGAAGGTGLVVLGLLGAVRRPGIEVVLELARFDHRSAGADLVVTGEGSFDHQSLGGKTPVGVAAAAAQRQLPVVVLSGRRTLAPEEWRAAGFLDARALTDAEPDTARCLAQAGPLLRELARGLGADLAASVAP
ncbi:glycerate kinase [Kineococcus sp. R8]|uniref:glycerate kinase n=1 Tax=Kineococcus siccus TaxID=2696567 RepID=UPI0014134D9E|nr:glycerate kinase [Kineococcus siccus]NAZ80848.1 glycerate kinase [Kineococcus siccus]